VTLTLMTKTFSPSYMKKLRLVFKAASWISDRNAEDDCNISYISHVLIYT